MQLLLNLDERLFFLINQLPHNTFLNQIFLFFSYYPLIIWILIGLMVVVMEGRKDRWFMVRLVLALVLAGGMASVILKPVFKRSRPDITYGEKVIVVEEKPAVIPKHNDYSFPSGHAALAFAGAYIVTRVETDGGRRRSFMQRLFLLFAVLTAFSRIYLGKHYLLDVIAGGMIGWWMGMTAGKLVDLVKPKPAV